MPRPPLSSRARVALLEPRLREILDRGGRVRVLTGGYLGAADQDVPFG